MNCWFGCHTTNDKSVLTSFWFSLLLLESCQSVKKIEFDEYHTRVVMLMFSGFSFNQHDSVVRHAVGLKRGNRRRPSHVLWVRRSFRWSRGSSISYFCWLSWRKSRKLIYDGVKWGWDDLQQEQNEKMRWSSASFSLSLFGSSCRFVLNIIFHTDDGDGSAALAAILISSGPGSERRKCC